MGPAPDRRQAGVQPVKLNLPQPSRQYSPDDQAQLRRELAKQLDRVLVGGQDCEIGDGRIILTSAGGSRFVLTVADNGTLSAVAL